MKAAVSGGSECSGGMSYEGSSHCGQTMKHVYSFKMDRFKPQDQ